MSDRRSSSHHQDDTDVAVWRRVARRVGRTLPRGVPSRRVSCWSKRRQPALRVASDGDAGARRRFSAPPASPVRHQQTIATNKRSTSAAARRPPAAPQSAAQAAGAARAPRRSISHAHRSPQARAGQSERCHKPPQRSCLNRGAVAHHPLARAASAAPSRARASEIRRHGKTGQRRPLAAPAVRSSTVRSSWREAPSAADSARAHAQESARSSGYQPSAALRCRRVAASVVVAPLHRCRADVAVWRRVSCWSHAAARVACASSPAHAAPARGADPRRRQHRPFATNKRSPPTNDRRRPPRGGRPLPHRAPHRRLAQLAHPAGRSRMLIALHSLALGKASDAISPLNAVVEPGCCRTPPPSSRRQRAAPRSRARANGIMAP